MYKKHCPKTLSAKSCCPKIGECTSDGPEVYRRSINGVATLTANISTDIRDGTGFLISPIHMVTSAHVISDAVPSPNIDSGPITGNIANSVAVYIDTPRASITNANVLGLDLTADIAVLQLASPIPDSKVLEWTTRQIQYGEEAWVLGTPLGDAQSVSEATVRDYKFYSTDQGLLSRFQTLLLDGSSLPGDSGSPCMLCDKTVGGVMSGQFTTFTGRFIAPLLTILAPIMEGNVRGTIDRISGDVNLTWYSTSAPITGMGTITGTMDPRNNAFLSVFLDGTINGTLGPVPFSMPISGPVDGVISLNNDTSTANAYMNARLNATGVLIDTPVEIEGVIASYANIASPSLFLIEDGAFSWKINIGLVSSVDVQSTGGFMTIAVPSYIAKPIADAIISGNPSKVDAQGNFIFGYLGVYVIPVSINTAIQAGLNRIQGYIVIHVVPGTPASSSPNPLMDGDIILTVTVNGITYKVGQMNSETTIWNLIHMNHNKPITLLVRRNGIDIILTFVLSSVTGLLHNGEI